MTFSDEIDIKIIRKPPGVGERKVFICKQVCRFLEIAHFWSQVQPSNPMELPQTLCSLESLHFSFFGTVFSFCGSFLDQILSKKRQKTCRLAPGARLFCTREG